MIKVAAPNMALKIIDNAIQAYAPPAFPTMRVLARDYASMPHDAAGGRPGPRSITAPLPDLKLGKYANSPNYALTGSFQRAPLKKIEGASSWPGRQKDEEFSGTKPVEERHRIDELRLDRWMASTSKVFRDR